MSRASVAVIEILARISRYLWLQLRVEGSWEPGGRWGQDYKCDGGTDEGAELQSAVSTEAWVVAQVNTPSRAGTAGRAGWAGRAIRGEGIEGAE